MSASRSLVIVESPAKARTIAGYLGDGFVVESSIGHVRDLPRNASDVPAKYKGQPWARLGVDVENDFKPLYVVHPQKKQQIAKLKALLKTADALYLATDEDREGESIAWHLLEVLKPKVPVKRMVFHEITKKAIQSAIESPRDIDRRLVDAQEARRILDRLYGYAVSPVLWKKVKPRLSAGRVQSVALRIIVDRERARMRFHRASYWDIEATLQKSDGSGEMVAKLMSIDGKRLATGKDFGENGELKRADAVVLDEASANALAKRFESTAFKVSKVERKPYRRSPAAPFMTSTLQQEASRKLRYGAQRTMRIAQRLYESGYITYMRTDSTTLSDTALTAARTLIGSKYGAEYVPAAPRTYSKKVKNAQEAHEAIRPAGDSWKTPEVVAREVGKDEAKLYELVWKRTVASQMNDARGETLSVRIRGDVDGKSHELGVSGRTIEFPGFLRAYVEGSDDPDAELGDREKHLPKVAEGEGLANEKFIPQGHETQPPSRYTEASLVRRLEEMGVGRPSTYASIITTIEDRGYVWKKGSALIPGFVAFSVIKLLEEHFPSLVDYAFTAKMEDELDEIASGQAQAVPWLERFYLGPPAPIAGEPANENGTAATVGLLEMVTDRLDEIDASLINRMELGKDPEGRMVIIKPAGQWGAYLVRGEDPENRETVSVPDDLPPDELTLEKAIELLDAPSGDRTLGNHPDTGEPVLVKAGRYGPYVQLGDPADKDEKPKTGSLFKTMTPETITLAEAVKLLSLPRAVGTDANGEVIESLNGRYGPYIKKGKETRSLESEDKIFTVTLEEAEKLLAAPKVRGRRTAANTEPLRTLGKDTVSDEVITVKEGRWGPYVTDGETNASLRKGDTVADITTERACELLQMRRERGPSKKKRKKAKKKTAKKKTAKKKTAKKKTAKKKTAKKKTAKKAAKKKTAKKAAKVLSEKK